MIKPWQWGKDFTNWIYYLSYGIFTYSVLLINYLKCWFYPIAAIICVLLLFGVAMLLPWNRKSINYLISCEMAIMTANMFDHKLIYLSMYGCVLLLLYLTEQLQIWIKRFIDKTTAQEQRVCEQHYKILAVWLRSYRDDNIIHNYLTKTWIVI